MKLLVYCYEFPPIGGGAGNALFHLSKIWVRMGHEVTVVTSLYGDLPKDQNVDGVRVLRLEVGRRSLSRGRIREMVRYMLQSRRTAGAVYQKVCPDLAVAFMTLPSGVAPQVLKRRHNLPFATELRGGDVPGFLPEALGTFHLLTRSWIRSIWNASSVVIANSDGLAALARRAAPGMDCHVIPNGVDVRVFSPASRVTDRPRCRCVFVGRMVDRQKKISRLIEIVNRRPQLELELIGAGPDEDRLKRLAAPGASDRIRFTGWLKDDALLQALRSADMYVSASLWEGMSNSALEAMSCGLPLILSDISGHRELVEECENGHCFDPASAAQLEERLIALAADPGRRRAFGAASRRRAVERFD